MTYQIKNWKKFQHFKDRRPPWVKLYRDLLDDFNWHNLSGDAAKSLTMLWLIASETDGYLPDIKTISFRLRLSQEKTKQIINELNQWIIEDDINVISDEYQDDTPETETYREEREKEAEQQAVPLKIKNYFLECQDYIIEKFPNLDGCDCSPIHLWQKSGYDFETQIKPVIDAKLSKGSTPASFNYFTPALEESSKAVMEKSHQKEKIEITPERKAAISEWKKQMGIYT